MWRSLVARFVRDEEAVGSNPATPTVNRRDRLVPAILYVHSQTDCQHGRKGGNEAGAGGVATMQHAATAVPKGGRQGTPSVWGYRTKRVGFMVTFPLFGAEKSVLKLVGANLKDGQNVLVL